MLASLVYIAGLFALVYTAQVDPAASLVVDEPPNFVRPYVIPHNHGPTLAIGSTAGRFPVTSPSSGGAITLLTTNGGASSTLNVFPHLHQRQYENFFCSRGSVQLWMQGKNESSQNVRRLSAGDYGASPPNTTHTFQIVEPNTEMFGVIFDGGLEQLFFGMGAPNLTYATFTPFDPARSNSTTNTGQPPPGLNQSGVDIIPQPNFVARRDITNGSAPEGTGWHTQENTLPADPAQPYYVARDSGPKYLNSEGGMYQVIETLNTATQSSASGHNFTLSFISMSMRAANATTPLPKHKYAGHGGFRVEDGAVMLSVDGYPPTLLLYGDVAFIPGNTSYTYYAPAPVSFTRILAFAAEFHGLDSTLISRGMPWNSPVWPTT